MELISVVIPVYNAQLYLERAVRSLMNQSYREIEIILIDDGSIDNSGEICDTLATEDARINVIHKTNGGVSAARNQGITIANGKYISFVDADDYVEETYLEKLHSALKDNDAQVSICGFKKTYIDTDTPDKLITMWGEVKNLTGEEAVQYASDPTYQIVGYVWGSLYDLETIRRNGIRFNEEVRYCEDLLFKSQLFLTKLNVVVIPDALYVYCIRKESTTGNVLTNTALLATQVIARNHIMEIAHAIPNSDFERRATTMLFYTYFNLIKSNFITDLYPEKNEEWILQLRTIYEKVDKSSVSLKDKILYRLITMNLKLAKFIICRLKGH